MSSPRIPDGLGVFKAPKIPQTTEDRILVGIPQGSDRLDGDGDDVSENGRGAAAQLWIEPDFTEQIFFDACGIYIYIYMEALIHIDCWWSLGCIPGTVGKTMP